MCRTECLSLHPSPPPHKCNEAGTAPKKQSKFNVMPKPESGKGPCVVRHSLRLVQTSRCTFRFPRRAFRQRRPGMMSSPGQSYDVLLKLVLIGDGAVGKSSLLVGFAPQGPEVRGVLHGSQGSAHAASLPRCYTSATCHRNREGVPAPSPPPWPRSSDAQPPVGHHRDSFPSACADNM